MLDVAKLDEFNQRLTEARDCTRRRKKLHAMLLVAEDSLAEVEQKRDRLKDVLKNAQDDVDALEGLSLTAMFYQMLGTKEQRLEKERQDLLAAKLKHDQACEVIEGLCREIRDLSAQLKPLTNQDSSYQDVLDEKAAYLEQSGSRIAKELIELDESIDESESEVRELEEAIQAGMQAMHAIDLVDGSLKSAAGWGTFDMLGGGFIATMAKHSKLDAAQSQLRDAETKLLAFQEELADTNERLGVTLRIDGFMRFSDYFFDGLIVDWMVQSKIANAKREVVAVRASVKSSLETCRKSNKTRQDNLRELKEERNHLIESAG